MTSYCERSLNEQKGHIFLLAAAEKVHPNYSKAAFVLVGYGPLMEELKKKK